MFLRRYARTKDGKTHTFYESPPVVKCLVALVSRVNHQCRHVSPPSIRASAEGLAPMGASRRLKGTTPSTNEHQAQGLVESSPSARDAAVFPLSRRSCFRRRRYAAGPQLAERRVIGPPST